MRRFVRPRGQRRQPEQHRGGGYNVWPSRLVERARAIPRWWRRHSLRPPRGCRKSAVNRALWRRSGPRVEQIRDLLFRSALPVPSRFGKTHSLSPRGRVESTCSAALPMGRIERPVLVVSMRRQPEGHRSRASEAHKFLPDAPQLKRSNEGRWWQPDAMAPARAAGPRAPPSLQATKHGLSRRRDAFQRRATGLGPLTSPRFSAMTRCLRATRPCAPL